ncbi:MAG: hypothetical protein WCI67_15495 [Chloroflexales bacterium]
MTVIIGALALWQQAARRVQVAQIGSPDDGNIVRGFHDRERSDYYGGRTFRWSMPTRSNLRFWAPPPSDSALLSLWMSVPDPAHMQTVSLTMADVPTGPLPVGTSIRRYTLLVPTHPVGDLVVDLESPHYPSADPRELGVVLWQARLDEVAPPPISGVLSELLTFPQLPLTLLLLALAFGRPGRRAISSGAITLTALTLFALSRLLAVSPLLLATLVWHVAITLLAAWVILQIATRVPRILPTTDRRAIIWLALSFAAIVLLTFSPAVYSDGNGYFAYVRSIVVDGDLSFANEYAVLWRGAAWSAIPATGLLPNPWSIGPALIWMPLYGLTHAILRTLPTPWSADGYSLPYVTAAMLTTALSVLLLLIVTYRICRRWVSPGAATLAVLTVFFCSTLWYYSMRLGSFAHGLSAASTALFLLAWVRLEEQESVSRWLVLGLAAGLVTLVYWACAVLLILPLVTLLHQAPVAWRTGGWRRLAAYIPRLALAALAALLVFSPQMIAWAIIYGSPLIKPEATPSIVLVSHLAEILFAPYGLLVWTPAMFVGAIGLTLLWRHDRWMMAGLLLSCGTYLFYNSIISDWHGSGAFGLRRLTSLVPWCAIGLALVYERLLAWRKQLLVVFSSLALSLWMLMQLIRYEFRYFPDRTPLGIGALSPTEFFLTRSLLPSWNLFAYIRTSAILKGFSDGRPGQMLAIATLIVLALAVGGALAYTWGNASLPGNAQQASRRYAKR